MAARPSMAPKKGGAAHPALLQPPFFVVDGISPSAPISQQMEQIDQMNTLLLQDIDYNFARFHEIITSRILPNIKRFALASEPTREASEFWRSFFEQAAGTRLAVEQHQEDEEEEQPTVYDDQTVSLAHDSFNPATSSTPARRQDDSMEDSVGSPFEHVDRQLGSLAIDDTEDTPSLPSAYGRYNDRFDESSSSPPVRRDLLSSFTAGPSDARRPSASSLAPGAGLAPGTPGRRHSALIDLTQTPLNARFDSFSPSPAMSPPVTMKFTLPPRAEAMLRPRGDEPLRRADKDTREMTNLLDEITKYDYAPSPRAATPEALRRYSVMPGEIGRRLFDDDTPKASSGGLGDISDDSPFISKLASGGSKHSTTGSASAAFGSGSKHGSIFSSGSRPALSHDSKASSRPEPNLFSAKPAPTEDTSLASSLGFGRPPPSTTNYTYNAGDESVNLLGDTTLDPTPRRRSLANTSFGSDIQTSEQPVRVIGDDESIDESFDDTFDATATYGQGQGGYYQAEPQYSAGSGQGYDPQAAALAGFEFVDDSYVSEDGDTMMPRAAGTGVSEVFGRPGEHESFRLHQQDEMVTYHGGRLEDAAPPASPTQRRE
ncbi:hypothetical protein A1Q2_01591 [Trichosporon asahii var. asahii CBS 8904]|uniref:DASH complex subunit ASK1 n=1 Tax=Trichosporon asahii var. asahii (strain CBS 8904) TaxID=1220162 RepID=K1VUE4_TRIAC|nr:hypothetical protein A1Q2_01591 [Trichosporon asahii var. asahii CBS 8904]